MANPLHSNDLIAALGRITPEQTKALTRLGLITLRDLLYHFPVRHIDAGKAAPIDLAADGERMTLYGQVEKNGNKKIFPRKSSDGRSDHPRPKRKDETRVVQSSVHGEDDCRGCQLSAQAASLSGRARQLLLLIPRWKKLQRFQPTSGHRFSPMVRSQRTHASFPVYPESKGITSTWFYHKIRKLLGSDILDELIDPIPDEILKRYNLPTLQTALVWIHTPRDAKHAISARKRFAFEGDLLHPA